MKALDRAIERFCYKHPRFGITKLMLYITVGSAIVYIFGMMDTTGTLTYFLTFDPNYILRGQVWRLITWVFISDGSNIIFEAIILYFYYFIGSTLEAQWGTGRFTIYYLLGVALNIVFGFAVWAFLGSSFTFISGAFTSYYLNLSMFFAFAALFPEHRVLVFFIIPVKIKWLALIDAAFFIYYIVVLPFPMNLLPVVAILNFLIFCADDLLHYLRPLKARASPNTINFKRAARKVRQQQSSQPYRHKCAVCGKTDAEYPNMEFRYCSRCEGYHCFCMEHINNHVHFK